MMLASANPFDQFDADHQHTDIGSDVAPAPAAAPVALASPAAAAPAANPFDQFDQPDAQQAPAQQQGAPDQAVGGFSDQLHEPGAKLSPEDEAVYSHLLHTADARTINGFLSARGYAPRDGIQGFVAARDKLVASGHGNQVNYGVTYDFPKVAEQSGTVAALDGAHSIIPGGDAVLAGIDALDKHIEGKSNQTLSQDYEGARDNLDALSASDAEHHPYLYHGAQLVAGLAVPTGLEGMAARVESEALAAGATATEARSAVLVAIRNQSAKSGAIYSGAHGVLDARTPGDAVTQGATGAVLGGLTGGVIGAGTARIGSALAERAAARAPAALTDAQLTGQAAGRQGLDLLPADTGGPVVRGLTSATAQTPLGVVPIANAAARLDDQAGARVASIANDLGTPAADVEGIGTAGTEGAVKYAKLAKQAGGRLYDAAATKAGDAQIDLKGARDVLDQQITRLQNVPGGGAGLKEAQDLRAALDKPYPVQGVRDMRTENFVAPDFRGTPVEARMKAVTNAAADDVVAGLQAQGKGDAADLFRAADNHWRETLINLKRNIEPIVGSLDKLKSPEAVATALNSAMKNNGGRVANFINSLPSEQQGVVRASMLNPLGRDASGNFSISKFGTDWNKLSTIAKRGVFGGESRAALDDLATVGEQAKAANKYANHSNTARGVIADRMLGTLGTGATLALGLKTMGTAIAGQYGMGVLLASPRFARWLARAPKTALSSPAYLDRLTRIAQAEPAIANQVLQFQQRLTDAFASTPTRLAANEPGDELGNRQGNAGQQQTNDEGAQP